MMIDRINSLLASGAVEKVGHIPWIISPLQLVSREEKEPRLVFNVSRTVNMYIDQPKVKLSSLEQFYVNVKDYFATADLKSGYFHLAINGLFRDLFGFEWEGQFYSWGCAFPGASDMVL